MDWIGLDRSIPIQLTVNSNSNVRPIANNKIIVYIGCYYKHTPVKTHYLQCICVLLFKCFIDFVFMYWLCLDK